MKAPRTIVYVAAETVQEAMLVCQSPLCRDRRQVRKLLEKYRVHKLAGVMHGWKLTITAERIDD